MNAHEEDRPGKGDGCPCSEQACRDRRLADLEEQIVHHRRSLDLLGREVARLRGGR